jgi:hypothetical protein
MGGGMRPAAIRSSWAPTSEKIPVTSREIRMPTHSTPAAIAAMRAMSSTVVCPAVRAARAPSSRTMVALLSRTRLTWAIVAS